MTVLTSLRCRPILCIALALALVMVGACTSSPTANPGADVSTDPPAPASLEGAATHRRPNEHPATDGHTRALGGLLRAGHRQRCL
jgi:hypothetical protein